MSAKTFSVTQVGNIAKREGFNIRWNRWNKVVQPTAEVSFTE